MVIVFSFLLCFMSYTYITKVIFITCTIYSNFDTKH